MSDIRINGSQMAQQKMFQAMEGNVQRVPQFEQAQIKISNTEADPNSEWMQKFNESNKNGVEMLHMVGNLISGFRVPADFKDDPTQYMDSHPDAVKYLFRPEYTPLTPRDADAIEQVTQNYGKLVEEIRNSGETDEVKQIRMEKLDQLFAEYVDEEAISLADSIAREFNKGNEVHEYHQEYYGMTQYDKIMSDSMEERLASNIKEMLLKAGEFIKGKPDASKSEIAYFLDKESGPTTDLGNLSYRDVQGVMKLMIPNNYAFKILGETYRQEDFAQLSEIAQKGIALSYEQAGKNRAILDRFFEIQQQMAKEAEQLAKQREAIREQIEELKKYIEELKKEYGNIMVPDNAYYGLYKHLMERQGDLYDKLDGAGDAIKAHRELYRSFEKDPKPFLGTDRAKKEAEIEREEQEIAMRK